MFRDFADGDKELFEDLLDFAESRHKVKHPMTSELAAKRFVIKLRRLSSGDRAVTLAMLDKAIERGWTSVYPLKADEMPRASESPGSNVEERPGVEIWTPGGGSDE